MFGRSARPAPNFLDFVPVRRVDSETRGDGCLTLLRPKFVRGPLARWVQPRLAKPFYKVHLDAIGSAVWEQIDGARTVGEIAIDLERRFGDRVKPAHQRVSMFVGELARGRMVELKGDPG
jgi:hypothetical protein